MKSCPPFASAYTEGPNVFDHAVHRLEFEKHYNERVVEVQRRWMKLEFPAGVFSGFSHVIRRCALPIDYRVDLGEGPLFGSRACRCYALEMAATITGR